MYSHGTLVLIASLLNLQVLKYFIISVILRLFPISAALVETRNTKSGGGGAVRFRPHTKSGGGGEGGCPLQARYERLGGGGGGGGCCPLKARYEKRGVLSGASGPIQKAGGGGGCLAEEGAVPYMKGGLQPPNPPPPLPLDPPLDTERLDNEFNDAASGTF